MVCIIIFIIFEFLDTSLFFIIFLVDLSYVIPISTEGDHNGAVQLNEMYMNSAA